MLPLSFKNRLAFNFMISTALITIGAFFIVYSIVKYSVYSDVNADLEDEISLHFSEMDFNNDIFKWVDKKEWQEKEHNELTVDPVFVEVYDPEGNAVERSPNLKGRNLYFDHRFKHKHYIDTVLNRQAIREVQVPIIKDNRTKGFLLIGMSLEDENAVLANLRMVLVFSVIGMLLLLFMITRYIAGRSIRPIIQMTETTGRISRKNLGLRIALPANRDELYVLSKTINDLLERIENAVEREKQFTSDASHELRTPLAVIKGTLEVLIRKPREKEEYEKTVNYCISEVNRMNNLVDQLLLLARFENSQIILHPQEVVLNEVILESLERLSPMINTRKTAIDFKFDQLFPVYVDAYKASIVIENILSNAVKYSDINGTVEIVLSEKEGQVLCRITDYGIGISEANINRIYEQFYRSGPSDHPDIKGTGIGLSIVKRLCDLMKISIEIQSVKDKGTSVTMLFPER
ncbi:MAG: two-component sensor histidine kinase [Flavobacterium sp. BFFFF1]|uniref:sensor histidine kinase n=1 Tax=unclassified Flavobacterium TaxID=196869 RepID=UPI000BC5F7F4|nr:MULTISPECIES: ATP-binding protein [unclassified Flavobacterium]OYU81280.1 MAG: two-component sensor histidine kinase [Flavobacterium sp. BFFFF1]